MTHNYLIVFTLVLLIANTAKSEECLQDQICVPIDHCSKINKRLYEPNLNEAEKEELRKLQCGFQDHKVYVCCNSSLPKPGECGLVELEEKVTKGHKSNLGQFPWVVLIGRRWKEANNRTGISYECGGSIINDRYILTAAHCVKFFSYINYRERIKTIEIVKLGEWNTETDPDEDNGYRGPPVIKADVERIIPHKEYKLNKKYHDIALLRLKEKIEYTKLIRPICLPFRDQIYEDELIVVGWGKTNGSNNDLEKVQRFAKINLIDNEACDKKFPNFKIESTQLCAGTNGSDSCGGDSGGPLAGINTSGIPFYYYLGGIVSFGTSACGTEGIPGVYTDVRKYIDWIQQNIIH